MQIPHFFVGERFQNCLLLRLMSAGGGTFDGPFGSIANLLITLRHAFLKAWKPSHCLMEESEINGAWKITGPYQVR